MAGVKLKQARAQFRFSRSKHPDFLKLDALLFRLRSPDIAKQADRAERALSLRVPIPSLGIASTAFVGFRIR
jgi:hypothetical protein